MGTTLTGTTPQDTYDSLIKVTDNGPLSGSLKTLTDGLGNDSALALSTTAIQVTGINSTSANNVNTGYTADLYAMSIRQRGASAGISGSNFTAQLISATGAEGLEIYTPNAKELVLGTNATERMRITSTGNVGIGTNNPSTTLHLDASGGATIRLQRTSASSNRFDVGTDGTNMEFNVRDTGAFTFGGGNVGIGTSSPQQKLQIYGNGGNLAGTAAISFGDVNSGGSRNWVIANGASASGVDQIGALTISRSNSANGDALAAGVEIARFSVSGLSFNGDTAEANALSDYEQGTWTMGVSFGGASVGVTTSSNTGTYTKIGRQVTAVGYIALTSKGSSTGQARVTGLPFTIANGSSFEAAAACRIAQITFADFIQINGNGNATTLDITEVTNAGVITTLNDADFANNSEIFVSITYFV